jgi:hypothetical protein
MKRCETSPASLSQQPRRELSPTHMPAGTTDAAVQVSRARPAISRRLWPHRVTLPAAAPPALGSGVSSGDAATIPNVAGDHRPDHGRIRAAQDPSPPLQPGDRSRRINLTTPLLLLLRYSAPTWVPFSATERRMSRTRNTSRTASAAEAKKTSKYASDNAC